MKIYIVMNDRITYNESCLIVNALNTYYVEMKKAGLSKPSLENIENVSQKYEKLENQILDLRIKE